ncbi:MAG: thiamine-phosphate kinase, partial [Polyangiales bacterium]
RPLAEPEAVLLSLALPKGLPDAQLLALVDGAQQAALAVGARLVGGNLSSAEALALHTTVVGRSPGRILQRRGARVSDGIFISGPLGGAAAGLAALLQRDRQTPSDMPGPDLTPFITRWQAPSPHFEAARRALRAGATAAIDLSDGLVQDLSHLCRASAVGATLHLAALPQAPGLAAAAAALGQDVNPWLLSGGEDYVLLLTLPAGAPRVSGLWRIGAITEDTGQVRVLDANGHPVPCDQGGFVHRG